MRRYRHEDHRESLRTRLVADGKGRGMSGHRSRVAGLFLAFSAVLGIGAGEALAGGVLFVDQAVVGGAGDGSSWTDAFSDLHGALAAARAAPGAYAEIWVAGGIYTPAPPGGPRTVSFELVGGVAVLGGFAGDESSPDERPAIDDAESPVTVLSGDLLGDDVYDEDAGDWVEGTRDDNAARVVRGDGPGVFVLDRLEIRGGHQDIEPGAVGSGGGAIFIEGDLVELRGCGFIGNSSRSGGGALAVFITSEILIDGCTFERNEAPTSGGAVWVGTNEARDNSLEIHRSRFAENRVHGVMPTGFTPASIVGGALHTNAGSTVITASVFDSNSASRTDARDMFDETRGGAIDHLRVGGLDVERRFEIHGCEFVGNTVRAEAGVGAFGGAVFSDVGLTVIGTRFEGNSAEVGGSVPQVGGGALNVRAFSASADTRVEDSEFTGNTLFGDAPDAAAGSAINYGRFFSGGQFTIEGTTITENLTESETLGIAGAVLAQFETGSFRIVDSVLVGNSTRTGGGFSQTGVKSGALAVRSFSDDSVRLERCTITGNELTVSANVPDEFPVAGGVAVKSSGVTIDRCIIADNRVETHGFGSLPRRTLHGGVAMGAYHRDLQARVIGSLITGNSAPTAGGLGVDAAAGSPPIEIINSTISGNESTRAYPGGVHAWRPVHIVNSILWGNESQAGPVLSRELTLELGGTVDSSLVGGWDGSIDGEFTHDADPLFAGAGDYRLSPGSPAIDSGDNTALPPGLDTDLDGNPRRVDDPATADTGVGPAPVVDRGAYEFVPVPLCPADISEPYGLLDLGDVVGFIAAYLDEADEADLAEPFGVWDQTDIAAFVDLFAGGCAG